MLYNVINNIFTLIISDQIYIYIPIKFNIIISVNHI